MTTGGSKRLVIALSAVVILFACLGAWLLWELAVLKMRVALAADQTEIIEEMRYKALRSNVTGAVELMDYAVHYYPSGTRQEVGSRLDRIVERQRESAVREIIAHLRVKSGIDLGDDPQPWIDKFARHHSSVLERLAQT